MFPVPFWMPVRCVQKGGKSRDHGFHVFRGVQDVRPVGIRPGRPVSLPFPPAPDRGFVMRQNRFQPGEREGGVGVFPDFQVADRVGDAARVDRGPGAQPVHVGLGKKSLQTSLRQAMVEDPNFLVQGERLELQGKPEPAQG